MVTRNLGLAALAAGLAFAAPASAHMFEVTVGTQVIPIAGAGTQKNEFKASLNGQGLFVYTDLNAAIRLLSGARLKFEYLGAESGFNNRFTTTTLSYQEFDGNVNRFAAPISIGTQDYVAGIIGDWLFVRNGASPSYGIGTQQFGIFLPDGLVSGAKWTSKVLYLGFDDTGAGPDDNHDDMIIRVTAMPVPEPATWAMLIAGFGLVGAGLRRRRPLARVSA
jgi:hypothetical protein